MRCKFSEEPKLDRKYFRIENSAFIIEIMKYITWRPTKNVRSISTPADGVNFIKGGGIISGFLTPLIKRRRKAIPTRRLNLPETHPWLLMRGVF